MSAPHLHSGVGAPWSRWARMAPLLSRTSTVGRVMAALEECRDPDLLRSGIELRRWILLSCPTFNTESWHRACRLRGSWILAWWTLRLVGYGVIGFWTKCAMILLSSAVVGSWGRVKSLWALSPAGVALRCWLLSLPLQAACVVHIPCFRDCTDK